MEENPFTTLIDYHKKNAATLEDIVQRLSAIENLKNSDSELITKGIAAKMLGVSVSSIDNYRREGLIRSYRIGNNIRFKKSELLQAFSNE